jgi:hypothetical protein
MAVESTTVLEATTQCCGWALASGEKQKDHFGFPSNHAQPGQEEAAGTANAEQRMEKHWMGVHSQA